MEGEERGCIWVFCMKTLLIKFPPFISLQYTLSLHPLSSFVSSSKLQPFTFSVHGDEWLTPSSLHTLTLSLSHFLYCQVSPTCHQAITPLFWLHSLPLPPPHPSAQRPIPSLLHASAFVIYSLPGPFSAGVAPLGWSVVLAWERFFPFSLLHWPFHVHVPSLNSPKWLQWSFAFFSITNSRKDIGGDFSISNGRREVKL